MFQKNTRQNMGEMHISTCQTGPVSLSPPPPPAGGERLSSSVLPKKPPPWGRVRFREVGKWDGGLHEKLQEEEILFRKEKGFLTRRCWGEMGRISKGMRQAEGTEAWKSLCFGKYRKFTGMRVRESFIA